MAIHWREASDGQEHWLTHWGWLKSNQTCTQAHMLTVFPLTTARDRSWWQLKKGAVDLPYTPGLPVKDWAQSGGSCWLIFDDVTGVKKSWVAKNEKGTNAKEKYFLITAEYALHNSCGHLCKKSLHSQCRYTRQCTKQLMLRPTNAKNTMNFLTIITFNQLQSKPLVWVPCKRRSSVNSGAWLRRFDDVTGVAVNWKFALRNEN